MLVGILAFFFFFVRVFDDAVVVVLSCRSNAGSRFIRYAPPCTVRGRRVPAAVYIAFSEAGYPYQGGGSSHPGVAEPRVVTDRSVSQRRVKL